MVNYWRIVAEVIEEADILLVLLDSRLPNDTRNIEIEDKIRKAGKPFIYVLTKCDLIDPEIAKKLAKDYNPSVFVSSRKHYGVSKLKERILIIQSQKTYLSYCFYYGAGGEIRTPDLRFTKPLLCQLSYAGDFNDPRGTIPGGSIPWE